MQTKTRKEIFDTVGVCCGSDMTGLDAERTENKCLLALHLGEGLAMH